MDKKLLVCSVLLTNVALMCSACAGQSTMLVDGQYELVMPSREDSDSRTFRATVHPARIETLDGRRLLTVLLYTHTSVQADVKLRQRRLEVNLPPPPQDRDWTQSYTLVGDVEGGTVKGEAIVIEGGEIQHRGQFELRPRLAESQPSRSSMQDYLRGLENVDLRETLGVWKLDRSSLVECVEAIADPILGWQAQRVLMARGTDSVELLAKAALSSALPLARERAYFTLGHIAAHVVLPQSITSRLVGGVLRESDHGAASAGVLMLHKAGVRDLDYGFLLKQLGEQKGTNRNRILMAITGLAGGSGQGFDRLLAAYREAESSPGMRSVQQFAGLAVVACDSGRTPVDCLSHVVLFQTTASDPRVVRRAVLELEQRSEPEALNALKTFREWHLYERLFPERAQAIAVKSSDTPAHEIIRLIALEPESTAARSLASSLSLEQLVAYVDEIAAGLPKRMAFNLFRVLEVLGQGPASRVVQARIGSGCAPQAIASQLLYRLEAPIRDEEAALDGIALGLKQCKDWDERLSLVRALGHLATQSDRAWSMLLSLRGSRLPGGVRRLSPQRDLSREYASVVACALVRSCGSRQEPKDAAALVLTLSRGELTAALDRSDLSMVVGTRKEAVSLLQRSEEGRAQLTEFERGPRAREHAEAARRLEWGLNNLVGGG